MIRSYWLKIRAEWRASRRLRLAVLVALAVLAFHVLTAIGDRREALAEQYTTDRELLARMEGISRESEWTARARDAAATFESVQAQMPGVSGTGLAQAELQNWLGNLAASTGVTEARVTVQDTLDVPDHPELLQVLARLDGMIPRYGQAGFVRAAAQGLPWIQVERMEIAEGAPARVGLVVRGYYRHVEAGAAANGAADEVAAASPAPQPAPSDGTRAQSAQPSQRPPGIPTAPAPPASPDATSPSPPRTGATPPGNMTDLSKLPPEFRALLNSPRAGSPDQPSTARPQTRPAPSRPPNPSVPAGPADASPARPPNARGAAPSPRPPASEDRINRTPPAEAAKFDGSVPRGGNR